MKRSADSSRKIELENAEGGKEGKEEKRQLHGGLKFSFRSTHSPTGINFSPALRATWFKSQILWREEKGEKPSFVPAVNILAFRHNTCERCF